MADAYFYSSSAQQMQLSGSVNGSTSSIIVDTVTGLPSETPFKLVIDPGLGTEEIVKVTEVSGTTLTVVRGHDGTSGQAHGNLAEVRHMVTAEDLRLSREHEDATSGVHGRTGSVVGTTDVQTLTNKDLSSGTNTFPSTLATDNEVSAAITAHAGSATTHGVSGTIVGTANTQALTNKDLSSPTNTFPSSLATDAELASHASTVTGIHGVGVGAIVGTALAQTLTNKTINGSNNTLSNIPQASVTGLAAALTALTSADSALDTRVDALEADTGLISDTGLITNGVGWSNTQFQVIKVGQLVMCNFVFTRTGAAVPSNSTGNITNVELGTINNALYRPRMFVGITVGWGGNLWSGYVNASGIIALGGLSPNVAVDTGDLLYGSAVYIA